ncbi:MAG TPA: hypothetical protein VG935_03845 [Patescibacteria group bacterium]|nr:hypothetical protein [Patescibacteria group bacterium]
MQKKLVNWLRINALLIVIALIFLGLDLLLAITQWNYEVNKAQRMLLSSIKSTDDFSSTQTLTQAQRIVGETSVVTIKQCSPNPVIFQRNSNGMQIFNNLDTMSHKLSFSANKIYLIPPGKSVVDLSFLGKKALDPYFCDTANTPVGGILVGK